MSDMSGNLGPNLSSFFPIKGLVPNRFIWSLIIMISPALRIVFTAPEAFVIISYYTPKYFKTLIGKVISYIDRPS